jgi:hypothetical protein
MQVAQRFEGKKFMWDGQVYPAREQAEEARRKYEADGFEARTQQVDDGFHVFTRREVKGIATESQEG